MERKAQRLRRDQKRQSHGLPENRLRICGAEWYVDKDGEFASRRIHHDGTNYYRYRRYLPDTPEDEIEVLKEKLYDGTATEDDINMVTEPLGSLVEAVCGWEPSYQMQ